MDTMESLQNNVSILREPVESEPEDKHPTGWEEEFKLWMKGHDTWQHGIDSHMISELKNFISDLLSTNNESWKRKLDHVFEVLHNCHGGGSYRRVIEQLKDKYLSDRL